MNDDKIGKMDERLRYLEEYEKVLDKHNDLVKKWLRVVDKILLEVKEIDKMITMKKNENDAKEYWTLDCVKAIQDLDYDKKQLLNQANNIIRKLDTSVQKIKNEQ